MADDCCNEITFEVSPIEVTFEVDEIEVAISPIGEKGDKGDQGDPGVDAFFQFTQSLPSDTWVITHALNKYPSVVVVDSGGNVIVGGIEYDSISQITVTFGGAFSGKAYLN